MSNHPPYRILAAPPSDAPSARVVVAFAAHLADRLGAELVLLAIAPVALPATAGQGLAATGDRGDKLLGEQARLDAAARARLGSLAAGVPARVSGRKILARGRPGPAIVLATREHEADLLVVGMGRGRVGHLLHDGVDRYVLHHSAVPVVVVPHGTVSENGALPVAA